MLLASHCRLAYNAVLFYYPLANVFKTTNTLKMQRNAEQSKTGKANTPQGTQIILQYTEH